MPRKRQDSIDASYLLNFSCGIPPDLPSTTYNPGSKKAQKKIYKKLEEQRRERQIREKLSSSFFLHTSSSHAFIISRKKSDKPVGFKSDGNEADRVKQWESVKIVKCLVPATGEDSSLTRCSICLDEFTAPRITKCGHLFCYPCILRHLNSSTKCDECKKATMAQCPCCYHWTSQDDLRPVEFVTVQPPLIVPGGPSVMEFRKLYRCRAAIAPFVPACVDNAIDDSSTGLFTIQRRETVDDLPASTDRDACFSRFNYVNTHSYQDHLNHDLTSLECELENLNQLYASIYGSNQEYGANDKYYISMALQAVTLELDSAVATAEDEERLQMALSNLHERSKINVRPYSWSHENENYTSNEKCESQSAAKSKNKRGFVPGFMYVNDDSVQFYQSADGQLCFLSGFNLNCLSYEFSSKDPIFESHLKVEKTPATKDSSDTISSVHFKPPFPDVIKGRVIDVECLHLTPDVRKRMPCFSHLPLYTDITMVELDINDYLSDTTKKHFKKDMERRKQKRQARREAEKKLERESKRKEEERIEQLKKGIQKVDPNDPFFHAAPLSYDAPSANTFDPSDFEQFLPVKKNVATADSLQPNLQTRAATNRISFSSICASNGGTRSGLNVLDHSSFPLLSPSTQSALPARAPSLMSKTNASSSKEHSSSTLDHGSTLSNRRKKGREKGVICFLRVVDMAILEKAQYSLIYSG
jgi:RING-finger-containing E3 ubiquitin ligase